MDKKTLDELIDRISSGEATDEELAAYNHYLNQATDAGENWNEQRFGNEELFGAKMLDEINSRIGYEPKRVVRLWPRIAAAASILLFLSIGGYFIARQNRRPQDQFAANDIKPGGNKAILTLSNGQKIVLTGKANGTVAVQGAANVTKTADGTIQYQNGESKNSDELVYNTLTTPKKGRYDLVMADGSEVTLDAESSITYPVAFNGKDRKVTVTGQAYFKVKHDVGHPFSVAYKGQTTEDIGTEFNINAYDNEPSVKTTLVSGSVKLKKDQQEFILKPGQQAIDRNNHSIVIQTVDLDGVTAWKNNYFQFEDDNLASIMRKVSRWYDVDIQYQDEALKTQLFRGTVSRFSNVSSVLNKLELTGAAHFQLKNKTIIVTK